MKLRRITVYCLLSFASWAFAGSAARADVAVMVPAPVDQRPADDESEKSLEELSRLLKLRGFDVIAAGQAGTAAETEQARGAFPEKYDPLYCVTPECANEYRKLFDALFAVQLTITNKGGKPSSVTVVLTESASHYFSASALVQSNDVWRAVRRAFEDARKKQEDGAGPWLTVSGRPTGATVHIDSQEVGKIPLDKHAIEPGSHRMEVKKEGFLSDVRVLEVKGAIDHEEKHVVVLQPEQGPGATASSDGSGRIRRSPWDWAVGGVVAAASAAHLVAGLVQKGKDGECAEREGGTCTELYGTGSGASRANMMIGFGAAGMVIGGLVMALGPIGTLGVRSGGDRAMLELKGTF